mmetsp:Transcript_58233/g.180888  ORF Transcript_58233/g.180888 Transcript_58233/m.180888 type:complete len:213 (+) Transcript_58233:296-934(+)
MEVRPGRVQGQPAVRGRAEAPGGQGGAAELAQPRFRPDPADGPGRVRRGREHHAAGRGDGLRRPAEERPRRDRRHGAVQARLRRRRLMDGRQTPPAVEPDDAGQGGAGAALRGAAGAAVAGAAPAAVGGVASAAATDATTAAAACAADAHGLGHGGEQPQDGLQDGEQRGRRGAQSPDGPGHGLECRGDAGPRGADQRAPEDLRPPGAHPDR